MTANPHQDQSQRPEGNRPPHHKPGDRPGRKGGGLLKDASTVLDMETDDVTDALQEGKSLADLASSKGITAEQLVAAIKDQLPTDRPTPPDFESRLLEAVNSKGLPKPRPGRPDGDRKPPPWKPHDHQR